MAVPLVLKPPEPAITSPCVDPSWQGSMSRRCVPPAPQL